MSYWPGVPQFVAKFQKLEQKTQQQQQPKNKKRTALGTRMPAASGGLKALAAGGRAHFFLLAPNLSVSAGGKQARSSSPWVLLCTIFRVQILQFYLRNILGLNSIYRYDTIAGGEILVSGKEKEGMGGYTCRSQTDQR